MLEANSSLSPSEACVDLIKHSEGCRLQAYKDPAGIPTIGYGSTKGVYMGLTIEQQEADDRLNADIDEAWQEAYNMVNVPLSQGQVDSLTDFVYNLGGGRLLHSTLLRKFNAGDILGAAAEFEHWVHVGGKVLQGLVARRAAEKDLFLGINQGE